MLNRLIKYKKLKEKEGYYEEVNYGDPQLVEKCPVSKIKISYERIHDYLIDDDFKCYDRLNEVMEIDLANTTIKMLQSDKGADHVNSSNEYIFTLENGYKKSRESEYFWTFNIFKKLIVYILHFGEKNIFGKCAGNPEDIFGRCVDRFQITSCCCRRHPRPCSQHHNTADRSGRSARRCIFSV